MKIFIYETQAEHYATTHGGVKHDFTRVTDSYVQK